MGIPSLLSGISKEKPGKKRALPEDPSLRLRTLDIVGDALCRALMEGSSCLHVLEQVHELRHLIAQHMKRLRQCASEIDDRYSPINKIAGAFLRSDSLQLLPIQSELLELLCEEKPERTKNVDLLHDLYRAYQWVYMNHDQSMGDFASDVEKISSATHKILHSSCGPDEVSALWDNWSQVVEKACAINAHISRVIRLLEPFKKERMYSLWNQ